MDAGLIPVKPLARAKGRLAGHLDAGQRHALGRALLQDTLDLCASVDFLKWWVVTSDEEVSSVASEHGVRTLHDRGSDLNGIVAAAAGELMDAGATSITVLPVDVPLAWSGDIRDLVDTGATSDMVVVPSRRDGGTNALYLRPPDLIAPRFGTGSLAAHVAAADRLGIRCAILELPRIAVDLDTIEDVEHFLARPRADQTATGRLLNDLD